jgi:acetyltransferase
MRDAKRQNLKFVFDPRSVAVIGASSREGTVGNAVFQNILFGRYTGVVYPVNPKSRSILGVKTYASVRDIPDFVDLAVVVVPSKVVADVIEECGEKGVKGAVVISAGFKEIGEKGRKLEQEVVKRADRYNLALVGPNCVGLVNTSPKVNLNGTFAKSMPRRGNISFISQSGALGVAALEYAKSENIGLAKFVSVGNKADINENDFLSYLKDDPETDVILLYLEDIVEHKEFTALAREITGNPEIQKPIIAVKSGRTAEGARASSSHTGALAGSDEVYDSAFAQCGVLRVDTMEELFDYAVAFSRQPLPKGNRVAIVTNAGGPGIIATDTSVRNGMRIAQFDGKTTAALKKHLPATANVSNPVDIIGDAREDRYEFALSAVLKDENVDGVIVISTRQMMADMNAIARTIVDTAAKYEKPLLACLMATVTDISEALDILDQSRIPSFRFPEDAARAMANMAKYGFWLHRPRTEVMVYKNVDKARVRKIIDRARKEKRSFLPEPEAQEVLKAYEFPVLKSGFAETEVKALEVAKDIGYPVALKIVSPDILHKFDVGGVKLGLKNATALKSAHKKLLDDVRKANPKARVSGVFVQEMAQPGKETIIGTKRDPRFGPLLMFGLGGVYVEILKDVSFRLAPIRELAAYNMIEQIKGYRMLEGFRGESPSDVPAIADCLMRLSQLVSDFPEIEELDINPLLVYQEGMGARVIDARILIRTS